MAGAIGHLALELDLVIVDQLGPDVHRRAGLQVRMAELENDLGVAIQKTVLIGSTPAEDEGVVIEFVVSRIQEEDFAHLRLRVLEGLGGVIDFATFRRLLHEFPKLTKAVDRREPLALEDELAFEILHVVERMAVAVGAFFQFGEGGG